MILGIFARNLGYDPAATPSPSTTPLDNSDASQVAHVTSAVIGCILGAALAGALFALGLALYRFRRRQRLRKRLLERISAQIDSEHTNDPAPMDEETRQLLIAERFHIVAERYWRQQRRNHMRNGRRPARRRDDLRDMSGDLYRDRTRGNLVEVSQPETAHVRFAGSTYLPIYSGSWALGGRVR
ncbi:hypothetical protein TWF694_007266 [Orbilia ellipsospora]|uniref:Uncharacterized protein n=1 Tax=Orbilia ellipsospora TaxID=2528407 RepID=A0AAV9XHM5_9PEZI